MTRFSFKYPFSLVLCDDRLLSDKLITYVWLDEVPVLTVSSSKYYLFFYRLHMIVFHVFIQQFCFEFSDEEDKMFYKENCKRYELGLVVSCDESTPLLPVSQKQKFINKTGRGKEYDEAVLQ